MTRSCLYRGHLVHSRRDQHVRGSFRYPIYTACLDLDELPDLARDLRLFAYNRPGLFSLYDRDYRGAGEVGVARAFADELAGAAIAAPRHRRLLTQLRVAHYVFNPVSFLLGYGDDRQLACAIAEVNNTYGGNHRYVLGPEQRIAEGSQPAIARFRRDKEFFVSPFIHGRARYDFVFDAPLDGDHLGVRMDVTRPDGARFFVAQLDGERVELTDRTLAATAVRYPLMTLQVIGLIYYEAIKMHLARVPFRRPAADHRPTEAP